MSAQPSSEAVELVAAVGRTEGVLAIAVWQGIDVTTELRNADAATEALFEYVVGLEQAVADLYRCPRCLTMTDAPERCAFCGRHREEAA
jgi:hypothetical protein